MKVFALFVLIVAILGGVWAFHTSRTGPFALKRSVPGHIVRWFSGHAGSTQWVEDLSDELSVPGVADSVRSWAQHVLAEQRDRIVSLPVDETLLFRAVPAADIPPPSALRHFKLVLSSEPVTYLHIDARGHVDALILSWVDLRAGVMISSDHPPDFENALDQKRLSPDIVVFSTYS